MKKLIIGGHVSTAGGLYTALKRAEEIGGNALQIFGASPRQWSVKMLNDKDVQAFRDAHKKSSIEKVYLHASYLPNLANGNRDILKKSIHNLTQHLQIGESIGADGLVFHIGSAKGMPKEKAIEQIARACNDIIKRVPGSIFLVLENAAGGGDKLGVTIEEIGSIMRLAKNKRLKVCIDTAHAFEAGALACDTKSIKDFFDTCDKEFGLDNLVVMHANDSKTAFNSHHDRHENIGKGHIGEQGFKNLAQEKRLHNKTWLLEVPGFEGDGPDARNVEIFKKIFF